MTAPTSHPQKPRPLFVPDHVAAGLWHGTISRIRVPVKLPKWLREAEGDLAHAEPCLREGRPGLRVPYKYASGSDVIINSLGWRRGERKNLLIKESWTPVRDRHGKEVIVYRSTATGEVVQLNDDGKARRTKEGRLASPWRSGAAMPARLKRMEVVVGSVSAQRLSAVTREETEQEGYVTMYGFLEMFRNRTTVDPWTWRYEIVDVLRHPSCDSRGNLHTGCLFEACYDTAVSERQLR